MQDSYGPTSLSTCDKSQQTDLSYPQRDWTPNVIAELYDEEKILLQQLQKSEGRIAQLRRQHHQELNQLRECFTQLSIKEHGNEEINSFEDLDEYHKKSDEAFATLATQVQPMVVKGNHIAILRSTSRGKSTMINSLLGKYEAVVGVGTVTTECKPYPGLGFVLWDTLDHTDQSRVNHESIALWKSMKHCLILIENTIKENSKMMKLFDEINLHYDIVVNKFDLVEDDEQTCFREQIRREVKTLGKQRVNSIFFLSAKYPQRFPDWIMLVNYLTSLVY